MGLLSKFWFIFEETLVQENNMLQLDLNELKLFGTLSDVSWLGIQCDYL